MHRKPIALVFAVMFVVALCAVSARAEGPTVKVMKKDGLGSYLTDGKGMTLYYFAKDTPGKSACTGACLEKWPALMKGASLSVMEGLDAKDFGAIANGGGKQVTFRGYPLYYFFKDAAPGDTKGHGVNDIWFVVDPAKFPPAK